jgi:hypothetical protein
MHEAAEPFGNVADPTRFAEFAIANDVDTDVRLLVNDGGNLSPKGPFISCLVIRLYIIARRQDGPDCRWTYKAADVRDKYAIGAAFHVLLPRARV